MGLEDLAVFRTLPGSTVFYPSDAVSTEKACELAANTQGICYIRTSRPETPVIYENSEDFFVGKAKVNVSTYFCTAREKEFFIEFLKLSEISTRSLNFNVSAI